MLFKERQCLILIFTLLFAGVAFGGPETTARLFKRYEGGGHEFRITEDLLTLSLSIDRQERRRVAIRVCSEQPLPLALAVAAANPFNIAKLLQGSYAYAPDQVLFLRADDCPASRDPSRPATEIWAMPDGATLPAHVEVAQSEQIRLTVLGKRPVNRGVRDYTTALQQLVKHLQRKPASVGVVFGYFLERPSPALTRRLREISRALKRSGIGSSTNIIQPRWCPASYC